MNKTFILLLTTLACAWTAVVADEAAAWNREGSAWGSSEFAGEVLGPKRLECRAWARECTITNLAWMVGQWAWIEKRRRNDYIFGGGHFTIDRFCVFPYLDYRLGGPRPQQLAAEFQTVDASGKLMVLPNSFPVHWLGSDTRQLWAGGPGYLVLNCAHETDACWEYLRLWRSSSQGDQFELLLFKFSDDPGNPLTIKGEWRDRHFPDWKEFEGAHTRRLPSITGEYRARYQQGAAMLHLREDGSYEQVYELQDGGPSLKNSGKWELDHDGKRIDLDAALPLDGWNGKPIDTVEKRACFFNIVRRFRGNILTGPDGTLIQVKVGNRR